MERFSKFAIPLTLVGALAGVLLAGCTTPAPYAPRTRGEATGYTDKELAANRYRVTFAGNSATPRETVENYLLLRAAEVALAGGSQSFMFDSRDTRADTRYDAFPEPGPGPGWGGYWRFRPYWGYGAFGPTDVDIITTTRYEAYAEIVLLTPDQAAHEPRAINARDVVSHLGPSAAPPPMKNPA